MSKKVGTTTNADGKAITRNNKALERFYLTLFALTAVTLISTKFIGSQLVTIKYESSDTIVIRKEESTKTFSSSSLASASLSPSSSSSSLSCFTANLEHTLSLLPNNNDSNHQIPSKPILNLGFPKMGSTTLQHFLERPKCVHMWTSHWTCTESNLDTKYCGDCMRKAHKANLPVLKTCGNYDAWTQMDFPNQTHELCYFPQFELLEQFHKESPHATFILPFRDMDNWYSSLSRWMGMLKRLSKCPISGYPPGSLNETKESMKQLFCDHVNRVRSFVKEHPSHTLVEIDIEDSRTADIMGRLFDVDGEECWGHLNVNKRKDLPGKKKHVSSTSSSSSLPCFRPILNNTLSLLPNSNDNNHQIIPSKPILNLGFPKTGSTSLQKFFQKQNCADMRTSHRSCSQNNYVGTKFCGDCMRKAHKANLPVLKTCGNYDVWAQIDSPNKTRESCYFPQIELLDEFHKESPRATFILPFLDLDNWYNSLAMWKGMLHRLSRCPISGYPPGSLNETRKSMKQLFCDHVNRVRSFVKQHPSHTLIEIDIEDNRTADIMGRLFHVDGEECWSQQNIA